MGSISVTSKKTNRTISFDHEFGDTLDESRQKYGDALVYNTFIASAVIKAQAAARGMLDAVDKEGNYVHTEEEVVEKMTEWELSAEARSRLTPQERAARLQEQISKLSPDQLKAVLAQLKSAAAE